MEIFLIILILAGIIAIAWGVTYFLIGLVKTFDFVESIIDKARHNDHR